MNAEFPVVLLANEQATGFLFAIPSCDCPRSGCIKVKTLLMPVSVVSTGFNKQKIDGLIADQIQSLFRPGAFMNRETVELHCAHKKSPSGMNLMGLIDN